MGDARAAGGRAAMFFFAYDGSINGDWVSHYAAQLASNHPDRRLHLLHVDDGQTSESQLAAKLHSIRFECDRVGVELIPRVLPLAGSVFDTLLSAIGTDREHFLVCGARARSQAKGLISGTVSERLLRSGRCNVLAVRVVHPGILGRPRRLLVPVSGHPQGFRAGLPFLRLFGSHIAHLHILLVVRLSRWRYGTMSHAAVEERRRTGQAYCQRVEEDIREHLALDASLIETRAIVSDDVPKEIVIAANQTKSQLIYLGASQRNLKDRFLYGNPIEQVLRDATCDVAIYRGIV